ncbi:MAG: elongation factor G [Acidobacteriota bacterium]|nr:elongation factor G [Blastocatellia bacterium]MDW8412511.1 elongation factor G [Acidobacteriota bacterium]
MKVYKTQEIRNIAIVGHGYAGKTSLVSAMLFNAGATTRLGKVADGTATTDFDEISITRKMSTQAVAAHAEWKGAKINILDTPGATAFIHEAKAALRVADIAVFVIDAVSGIGVSTEKAWAYAEEFSLPKAIIVNKMDTERADFNTILAALREVFTRTVVPIHIPIGSEKNFKGIVDLAHMKAYIEQGGKMVESDIPANMKDEANKAREALIEMVAEGNDELLEKFFEQGTLEDSDLLPGIKSAILERRIVPVFATAGLNCIAVTNFMDAVVEFFPSPADFGEVVGKTPEGEEVRRKISETEPYSAYVFRTYSEQFGRISLFKIYSGIIKSDSTVMNLTKGTQERLGPLHVIQGNKMEKIPEAYAGDICAVTKLKDTSTGDTFSDKATPILYEPVRFPEPAINFAIEPKSRQDEDKLSTAIGKLLEEDLALRYKRDEQTKEFLLSGSGQLHVEVVVEKLKKRYNVEVQLHTPKVPYKETFKARVEVQGRHKKQTGGRGQFGDCKCIFEPLERGAGFQFVDKIFGGAIPSQFRPAVEKGILEAATTGSLAGYPVVDFKVELIDGSFHPVDSDELSFKLAGRKAFRAAMEKAKPVLLEPIMNVEVVAPQEFSGDLMGDINARRGRIQGMDSRGGQQVIKAQVPLAEMLNYQPTLNSITGARGSYSMEFSHYDEVPPQIAQKVIAEAQAEGRVKAQEEE